MFLFSKSSVLNFSEIFAIGCFWQIKDLNLVLFNYNAILRECVKVILHKFRKY